MRRCADCRRGLRGCMPSGDGRRLHRRSCCERCFCRCLYDPQRAAVHGATELQHSVSTTFGASGIVLGPVTIAVAVVAVELAMTSVKADANV